MLEKLNAITVYASSSTQLAQVYIQAAQELGKRLAEAGVVCINGGGYKGLMGAINDAVLENGGKAIGIIPQFMVDAGWTHAALSELIITDGMHARKQLLAEKADACIALPGGVGTFDELMEILAWKQLGLYHKPAIILNVNGYYDDLLAMLEKAYRENFIFEKSVDLFIVAQTVEEAMKKLGF